MILTPFITITMDKDNNNASPQVADIAACVLSAYHGWDVDQNDLTNNLMYIEKQIKNPQIAKYFLSKLTTEKALESTVYLLAKSKTKEEWDRDIKPFIDNALPTPLSEAEKKSVALKNASEEVELRNIMRKTMRAAISQGLLRLNNEKRAEKMYPPYQFQATLPAQTMPTNHAQTNISTPISSSAAANNHGPHKQLLDLIKNNTIDQNNHPYISKYFVNQTTTNPQFFNELYTQDKKGFVTVLKFIHSKHPILYKYGITFVLEKFLDSNDKAAFSFMKDGNNDLLPSAPEYLDRNTKEGQDILKTYMNENNKYIIELNIILTHIDEANNQNIAEYFGRFNR